MRSRLAVLLVLLAASACVREAPPHTPYYYAPPAWYGYPPPPYAAATPPAAPSTPGAPLAPAAAIAHDAPLTANAPAAPTSPPPAPPPPAWYPQSSTPLGPSIPSGPLCLAELDELKIRYEASGPTRGVDTPVKARSPLAGVKWTTPGGGLLLADCRLVIALAKIAPELTALGVSEAIYSNAYSYRFTRHGRLSLHARGLAIDVHEVVVFGRRESVRHDFARGRGDGCQPTSPVLNRLACRLRGLGLFRELITPDHDADHQDHLHLGLAPLPAPANDGPNFELVDLGGLRGLR